MVAKLFNNIIYSMNQTEKQDSVSSVIANDVMSTCGKIKSAVDTLGNAALKAVEIAYETIQEMKGFDKAKLDAENVKIVPSCVENLFGEHYLEQLCPEELTEKESALNDLVQDIGSSIIAKSDRKDLDFEIRIKRDDRDLNAYVIPGGKIVLTTALLTKMQRGTTENGFQKRLAGVLSYLTARASRSVDVKKAQVGGLMSLINNVVGFVLKFFFPAQGTVSSSGKVKLTPEQKKKMALKTLVEQSVDLSSKIILENHKSTGNEKTRETALAYLEKTAFEMNDDELQEILDLILRDESGERFDEMIQEDVSKMMPNVVKLFA